METMTELYSDAELKRLARINRTGTVLACAIAGAGLLACIALCVLTDTLNAARLERAAIAAAVLSGWAALFLALFVATPCRRELRHAEMLRRGERSAVRGAVTVTDERVRIRGSIAIRKVLVTDGEGTRRLNVAESRAERLGSAPERLTLRVVNGYVAAFAAEDGAAPPPARSRGTRIRARDVFSQFHTFVLWLLACVLFWSWIFTLVTDTTADKKVTLFVDAYGVEDVALAAELERALPEGLRMVKVHPVSYAMFDANVFLDADLFIVRESEVGSYIAAFAPLPEAAGEGAYYLYGGVPYGLRVRDASTGEGAAAEYIRYTAEGAEPEDYYLFYGANSLHTGSADGAAFTVARRLMSLQ